MRVLNLELVSITDDFFKVGDNSLLAIKLVSEFNTLGFEYTPVDIFRNPTILLLSKLNRKVNSGKMHSKENTDIPFTQINQHNAEK